MSSFLGTVVLPSLESGPLVTERVQDWGFAAKLDTIEMQLLSDGRSRTVWILVDQGRAFIPCAIGAPPGKTWHLKAQEDGRSVVRIDGKRYPVTLARVNDPGMQDTIASVVADKYPSPPDTGEGSWYFRVESR